MDQNQFTAWLSRQSIPRLLGVLFGNVHDLEARLRDQDAEIKRLCDDIEWWKTQHTALTNSFLLSRGDRPLSAEPPAPPVERPPRFTPGEQLAVEIEAEKLAELMIYDPAEMQVRVEDLLRSPQRRDKEILRRLDMKLALMPLDDGPHDGVVIAQ